jgi:hypothetical protein
VRILTRGLENISEALATGGDVSLSSAVVHGGDYSLRTNAPGAGVAWASFGRADGSAFDRPLLYTRVWVYLVTLPVPAGEEIFVAEAAGGYKFFVRVNSSRKLVALRSNGTSIMATGTTALDLNTWYRIEFMVGVESSDGAGDGPWAVRLDGSPEISGTGLIGTAHTAFVRLGSVINRSPGNFDCLFDDLAVDDAGWPGAADGNLAAISQYYRRRRCF